MYRKEQRLRQEMEDQKQAITRVSNYPVVKDAWSKVSEVYQRGKDGSRILRFCGGMVEGSASLAYRVSQPVIERLPVEKVNDIAVSKLEVFEENYPVIAKPTEEVVDAVKTYSTNKLDEVRTYSAGKINKLAGVTGANYMLGYAETAVEKFLPEVESADSSSQSDLVVEEPEDAVGRVVTLGDKVKRRAYQHAMARVGALQRRSEEAVSKLVHTVDLIDFAKKSLDGNTLYEEAKERLGTVYDDIVSREEQEPLPPTAPIERRVVSVARSMSVRIRTTLGTMSQLAIALPSNTRASIAEAYKAATALLHSVTNMNEITDSNLILNLRANLDNLRARLVDIGADLYDNAQSIIYWSPLGRVLGTTGLKPIEDFEMSTRLSQTLDETDADSGEDVGSTAAAVSGEEESESEDDD